ncbi:MAG TPA: DUF2314 domain-containing protein [Cyclobacteriaceae bacterium]|nr:DUF2314 domain-containing protein [Cyclobacteriaceae bacterium]
MKTILLTITAMASISSCGTKNKQDDWDKKNIRSLEIDDPRVERAMKAAQDSLEYYVDYFKKYYGQENYSFYLKKSFHDNEDTEHMWTAPFLLTDNGFRCTLDNVPNTLTNLNLGDTVDVRFADIEDFVIVTADTVIIGDYLQKEIKR